MRDKQLTRNTELDTTICEVVSNLKSNFKIKSDVDITNILDNEIIYDTLSFTDKGLKSDFSVTFERLPILFEYDTVKYLKSNISGSYKVDIIDDNLKLYNELLSEADRKTYTNVTVELVGSTNNHTNSFDVKIRNNITSNVSKRIIPNDFTLDINIKPQLKLNIKINDNESNTSDVKLNRFNIYLTHIYNILMGENIPLPIDLTPKSKAEYILHQIYNALSGMNVIGISSIKATSKVELQLLNWLNCIIDNNIEYTPITCTTRADVYLNEIIMTMLDIQHLEPTDLSSYRNYTEYMYMLIDNYYDCK